MNGASPSSQGFIKNHDARPSLIGMDRTELAAALSPLGIKPYRAQQIFRWIYNHGVSDFEAMTNLSKDLRNTLTEQFNYALCQPPSKSADGTQKWLLVFDDRQEAEVFIFLKRVVEPYVFQARSGAHSPAAFVILALKN